VDKSPKVVDNSAEMCRTLPQTIPIEHLLLSRSNKHADNKLSTFHERYQSHEMRNEVKASE